MSLYYWRFQTEPRPTLAEFIDSQAVLILKKRGFNLYTIDGEIAVDCVCRFENLREELERLRDRLRFPESLALPNAKSSYRQDKRHYREILTLEDKKKIRKIFKREIELFGYAF